MEVPWTDNIEQRISAGKAAWLALAQSEAFAVAAAEVRAKRDEILADSDKMAALDRLGLDLPDKVTTTTMLTVVKALVEAFWKVTKGDIGAYRQALRDLPEQAGFPYDVNWPVKP